MNFKCGHPKSPENSYPVGNGFMRCLKCKRERNTLLMRWARRGFMLGVWTQRAL